MGHNVALNDFGNFRYGKIFQEYFFRMLSDTLQKSEINFFPHEINIYLFSLFKILK